MPEGAPEAYLTLPAGRYRPDGAVVDAAGDFWCAHFGHGKVTCHAPDGRETAAIPLPAQKTTCPAFGGDLSTLYVTSARQGLDDAALTERPASGNVFATTVPVAGLPEPTVILVT